MAGLGRGIPPRAGAWPSREAGGRGGRCWSPVPPASGAGPRSAGADRRPMPWLAEKGLLPGRGVPPGRPTGRGAGALGAGALESPERAAGASGASAAGVSAAAAAGAAGASSTGAAAAASAGAASAGAASVGALDADFGAGLGPGLGPGRAAGAAGLSEVGAWVGCPSAGITSTTGAGSAEAAFVGAGLGAGLGACGAGAVGASAGAADAFSSSPYIFLNRFATGGSTVEDADLTNSPISFSFSRTNLLSTPNSLASSCTRGLATLLLLARAPTLPNAGGGESDR